MRLALSILIPCTFDSLKLTNEIKYNVCLFSEKLKGAQGVAGAKALSVQRHLAGIVARKAAPGMPGRAKWNTSAILDNKNVHLSSKF